MSRRLYLVTALVGGGAKTLWIKASDETDAYYRAQSELVCGGKILSVREIHTER